VASASIGATVRVWIQRSLGTTNKFFADDNKPSQEVAPTCPPTELRLTDAITGTCLDPSSLLGRNERTEN